jgi:hypothetical protein
MLCVQVGKWDPPRGSHKISESAAHSLDRQGRVLSWCCSRQNSCLWPSSSVTSAAGVTGCAQPPSLLQPGFPAFLLILPAFGSSSN